jgi:hypothetical protein
MEVLMEIILRFAAVVAFGAAAAGCATLVALAPGAERVRITNNAADIASCKAVGSVRASDSPLESVRNRALGLGANTLFFTGYVSGSEEFVANNCP